MNAERKRIIDEALATYIFACNIPFVSVESEYFINFLRVLNPEYTPPSRKTVAGSLLDKIYNNYRDSLRSEQTRDGILMIDGWKNSVANTKNVVAILRTMDGQNMFLNSYNFSESRETGEALSEVVNNCREIALNQLNINIQVVLTDNAANMINMGNRLNIWYLTCNSHSGNLLFKSLTDENFDRKVTQVVKEFKSENLQSQLINLGCSKMILPGPTRWCSKRDTYKRCLQNLNAIREIIQSNQLKEPQDQYVFKNEVIETVLDNEFDNKLIEALLIFDPICELVNTCQKSNCSIAYAIEKWLNLRLQYEDNVQIYQVLEKRLEKVINKYGLAANYLNHHFKGRAFANKPVYVAMSNTFFNENLNEEGLLQLEAYTTQTGMFQTLFERRFATWKDFWRAARCFYPQLASLAEKLLNIPASTADLERLFSEWTLVHSKVRNKLKEQTSIKLIALYYKFRLKFAQLLDLNQENDIDHNENKEDNDDY